MDVQRFLINAAKCASGAVVTFVGWNVVCVVGKYTFGRLLFNQKRRLASRQAGEWAVISGASTGIGLAMARELAKWGLDIYLISNDANGLQTAASAIELEFGVRTQYTVADLTKVEAFMSLKAEINSLSSIACLINNAGTTGRLSCPFDRLSQKDIGHIVNLNVLGLSYLTSIALPKLLEGDISNRRPFIIFMSSASGIIPPPQFSVYAATKSYVIAYARSLASEMSSRGLCVQTFTPCFVATAMTGMVPVLALIPSPETYAVSSLSMLGVESECFGWPFHELQYRFRSVFKYMIKGIIGGSSRKRG